MIWGIPWVTPNTFSRLTTVRPSTEYSFISIIPPTFPSLHLSWAHHYWALRWGFLETSSRFFALCPVESGKLGTPLVPLLLSDVINNLCGETKESSITWDPGTLLWLKSLIHTGHKSRVIIGSSPCKRGSCCRVFRNHPLAQYLPKQNGVFGFCFGVAMLT